MSRIAHSSTHSSKAKRVYKRVPAASSASPSLSIKEGDDLNVDVDAGGAANVQLDRKAQAAQRLQKPPAPATTSTGAFDNEHPLPIPSNSPAEKNPEVSPQVDVSPQGDAPRMPPSPTKVSPVWQILIETYRFRPVEFVEDMLIRDQPGWVVEEWQKDFLRAISRGERRISVRAGHGVGKSAACAWALVWWAFTRYPQKSILTAPTQGQLFDALFAEVKRWINLAPAFMGDLIECFADRVELRASPENSFMSARTSSKERPEALAGIHSDNVLLVCDEAPGIPEEVYEAAVGSMSGYSATTILIGNPTRNTGMFFKSHHQLSSDWYRMHVSCVDSRLVSPDFVRQVAAQWGEDSNAYRVRVLGEFPLREDDVLIPAELVDAAMSRDVVLDTTAPILYGVDIARFGDDRTVLCKRQGNCVLEIKSWGQLDLMGTTGRIIHEAGQDAPSEIMVDSIGLGAGVADRLREQGFNVRDVNVAEASALNIQAARLRDELWITVKDWLQQRACRLPRMDELRQELIGPTYGFQSNGRIKVEGKAEMKKRGLRSPDMADALCLTFAGQAAYVGGRASSWVKGKPLKREIRGVV